MTAQTLPFDVVFRPGEPPWREVVYAATRAIVAGDMVPGAPFPSVRELSAVLRINSNTAHKVVSELVRDGLLQVQPGIGTIVTQAQRAPAAARRRLLEEDVERLVVEARRLGLAEHDVLEAVRARWSTLFGGARAAS